MIKTHELYEFTCTQCPATGMLTAQLSTALDDERDHESAEHAGFHQEGEDA